MENKSPNVNDIIIFDRIIRNDFEIYQLVDINQETIDTGFPKIEINNNDEMLTAKVGDKKNTGSCQNATVKLFMNVEEALEKLTAPDKAKGENIDRAMRGDYVFCEKEGRPEVIQWGLKYDSDYLVAGIRVYADENLNNFLPEGVKVGETITTPDSEKAKIKVLNPISIETFTKRFELEND